MKRIIPLILLIACVACLKRKEIEQYSGDNTIYFSLAADLPQQFTNQVRRDSMTVSFAFSYNNGDSLVKVPLRVTGLPANEARKYIIKTSPGSTAKEGTHFSYLSKEFTIPAGKLSDSVGIQLHRTADLKTKEFMLMIELEPNDQFSTRMIDETIAGSNRKVSLRTFRIFINDILSEPETWIPYYVGDFTKKKFYLMGEVLNLNLELFKGPAFENISFDELKFYGVAMQRYLNRMKTEGNTVYEEDGSEMVMGPGVQ